MLDRRITGKIRYGGDYNPEQWPEEIWEEDMRLLRLAGIDTLTVGVFSWTGFQPSEEEYDFSKMDKIVALARKHGMKLCLSFGTAAHPAWMATRYPDILRVDGFGRRREYGMRANSCPHSPTYEKYAMRLVRKMALRYGRDSIVESFHVSNELSGYCYCDNCRQAFRVWLKKRYRTIEALNQAFNTPFWSHEFQSFDEIVPPTPLSECTSNPSMPSTFPSLNLAWNRFMSDSLVRMARMEADTIRSVVQDKPITTNLMGTFPDIDYFKLGRSMDFVSWDSYPSVMDTPSDIAFRHALMRGCGKKQAPFALMEQTPSITNWQAINKLKKPGELRLQNYQAMAHGADALLYFQLRQSPAGAECFHGAVISHAGHEHTRVFREVQRVGEELKSLGDLPMGRKTKAEIALMFSWDNLWALSLTSGPNKEISYTEEVMRIFRSLHKENLAVDIIHPEDDLRPYRMVLAPVLSLVTEKTVENLEAYVNDGGHFFTGYFSGIFDEENRVRLGGYPGAFRSLLGIWVEEWDTPLPGEQSIRYDEEEYECRVLTERIHSEGAEVLAEYTSDFFEGTPALTRNHYGRGSAIYIGTALEDAFYETLIPRLAREAGVRPVLDAPEGVECTMREREGEELYFLLNHRGEECFIELPFNAREVLTGREIRKGEAVPMEVRGVLLCLREKETE